MVRSPRTWVAPSFPIAEQFDEHDPRRPFAAPPALEDRYELRSMGRVFLTGIQAIVRLVLEQQRLDRARGEDGRPDLRL